MAGKFLAYPDKKTLYVTSEKLVFLDSDDIIYPHGLDVMLNSMEQFPEAGIGLSYNSYDDKKRLPISYSPKETIETHFFKEGILYIGPSGAIYEHDFFTD